MKKYDFVVMTPSRAADLEGALDCIGVWCSSHAVTTVGIINSLIPTYDMTEDESREHIEYTTLNHMATVNGNAAIIDPINDYINREILLDEYMTVREIMVLPLCRHIPGLRNVIMISGTIGCYGIKYNKPEHHNPRRYVRHDVGRLLF